MEYGDFQCPYCANFALNILPQFERDYVETGKLAFEYRHYPFLGEESWQAAIAAECARKEGNDQFRHYHDSLFQAAGKGRSLAETIGTLPGKTIQECWTKEEPRVLISTQRSEGAKLGVNGTPYLYLNGKRIQSHDNYEKLKQEVEDAMASD